MALGILRVILALSIIIFHTGSLFGFRPIDGMMAVEIFFILSGFYMSLILNEKYINVHNNYTLFLTNRFLKIYPIYLFIFLLTVLTAVLFFFLEGNRFLNDPNWLYSETRPFINLIQLSQSGNSSSMIQLAFLSVVNLIIFGQDIALYLKQVGLLAPGFLIPQAWALDLELMFYIIAPFLIKRKLLILISIISLSLIMRFSILHMGFNNLYIYRFFPTQLAFFIMGCISYNVYTRIKLLRFNSTLLFIVSFFVIGMTIFFELIPIFESIKSVLYYLLVIISLPFMFIQARASNFDKFMGELSYPLYVSHILIVFILELMGINRFYLCITTIIITVIVSLILLKLIIAPIEKFRQSRIKYQQPYGRDALVV